MGDKMADFLTQHEGNTLVTQEKRRRGIDTSRDMNHTPRELIDIQPCLPPHRLQNTERLVFGGGKEALIHDLPHAAHADHLLHAEVPHRVNDKLQWRAEAWAGSGGHSPLSHT